MVQVPPLHIIARIHNDFTSKFGIPRQSGLIDSLQATVVLEPEYRNPDAFRGLEKFSHIWLLWQFSETRRDEWSPTVRPPRLGGNTRVGVFASRSPFRPNAIGLSCVKLLGIEMYHQWGPILKIAGADLLDNTPIYDIKPYVVYSDSHPEAVSGFAVPFSQNALQVDFPDRLLKKIPVEKREALLAVLAQDPRPAYQEAPNRIYGMEFAGFHIRFYVAERKLSVCEVEQAIK